LVGIGTEQRDRLVAGGRAVGIERLADDTVGGRLQRQIQAVREHQRHPAGQQQQA
jgi:hypothetical protein